MRVEGRGGRKGERGEGRGKEEKGEREGGKRD